MPRNLSSSAFMRPFVVLALPGMYLFYKYSQYKRQQQEQNRRKVTERELAHLNHKIDKLLSKLEENEPELATSQEDECVICVNAKATMQTSPCGHRVVCRKCFVKTIQMAVSQRLLPLRCVICRAKILRLKQTNSKMWVLPASASAYSMGGKTWVVPSSASQYSMAVPNSESLYSMASGSSSLSGVSSVSSATNSSSGSSHDKYRYPRQPVSGSLRKSQTQSMKYRLQEYKEPVRGGTEHQEKQRLTPIQEFQREFRAGKERSTSTRIRCAQKIVTQLETTPLVSNNNKTYFRSPLKPPNKEQERKPKVIECSKQRDKDEKHKEEKKLTDNKKKNEENKIERDPTTSSAEDRNKKCEKKDKKEEKKENKKESKKENKPEKEEKKELTKAEKKEIKKEAKAEKKNAKKEAKLEAKKEKSEKKEKNDKNDKKDKKEEHSKK